jgi:hypothetical protein
MTEERLQELIAHATRLVRQTPHGPSPVAEGPMMAVVLDRLIRLEEAEVKR